MKNTLYTAITLTAAFIILFLFVLTKGGNSLKDPLIDTSIEVAPKRNEKITDNGAVLPPVIDGHLEQGDYILTKTVTIPKGARLDIAEHTRIFANMDARILVQGEVSAENVSFQSNELHPNYGIWHGIVIDHSGSVNFSNVSINNATAGLTCSGAGEIQQSIFQDNTAAIVLLPNSTCAIKDTKIQRSSVGIQVIDVHPNIRNTTFISVIDEIRQY